MTAATHQPGAVLDGRSESADGKSVLGKVQLIFEAFQRADYELSLAELCQRTGMAKSTAHRLCQELVHWGWLEKSGNNYRLGLLLFPNRSTGAAAPDPA